MNFPSSASPDETWGLPEDKAASAAATLSWCCPCHVPCCAARPGVKRERAKHEPPDVGFGDEPRGLAKLCRMVGQAAAPWGALPSLLLQRYNSSVTSRGLAFKLPGDFPSTVTQHLLFPIVTQVLLSLSIG